MSQVIRPSYYRDIPAGAAVAVRRGVKSVELVIRKKKVWCEVKDVGGRPRAVVQVADWYAEYPDPDRPGKVVREKSGPDKAAAEALLLRRLKEGQRRRAGLSDPAEDLAARPLGEHLEAYLELLAAKGTGDDHRANVRRHCEAAFAGCRWSLWGHVNQDSLTVYLGSLRALPRRGGGRVDGASGATLNSYARSLKSFSKWLARRLKAHNPLDGFEGFNEEVGRRRSRRILTDAEFARLLAAARDAPRGRMAGADREMLYLVAAYTGFRASELAALAPGSFDLAEPSVRLDAGEDKAKRGDAVPLPGWLADRLRPWLAAKPAGEPVWPGRWADNGYQRRWLRGDLRRAGLPTHDDGGRPINFHGLRRKFVSAVVASGASVPEAQRLARHSSSRMTLEVYAQADRASLGRVADRLPRPDPGADPAT